MYFYVFDLEFNFHGVIDDYVNVSITRSYVKKTSFTIEVSPTEKNIELLKKGRLITKQNDREHAYIIETIEYIDGTDSSLAVTVFSLHHLLKKRIIHGQQVYSGSVGEVMSAFVDANAVNPTNPNRIIPNLVISDANDIGENVTEAFTDKPLDDSLFEISEKYGVSWDIIYDYDNERFVFQVWQGVDRSEQQNINSHVVFSKEFDNVINQHFIDSDNEYKNVAIVAGEGEGIARKRVIVNDYLSGFERDEMFVDARDLQSEYYDENDQEITVPPIEYEAMLIERGKTKLAEHGKILTLDSEIDVDSSFVLGQDFNLGDIVSVKNTKLGLVLHTRITQVTETYSKEGHTVKAEIGSNIPTLIERLRKEVRE